MKMTIMNRAVFGAVAVPLLVLSGAAQACRSDPFRLMWGSDIEVRMAVRTSESCRFGFVAKGTGNHVASDVVALAPQHGTIKQADATHWLYHPNPGFTGRDVLVIKATGDIMGNRHIWSGDINFTYDVSVVP